MHNIVNSSAENKEDDKCAKLALSDVTVTSKSYTFSMCNLTLTANSYEGASTCPFTMTLPSSVKTPPNAPL